MQLETKQKNTKYNTTQRNTTQTQKKTKEKQPKNGSKNGYFSLKTWFLYFLMIAHSLCSGNIFDSRPRNIKDLSTSNKSIKNHDFVVST